MAQGPQDRQRSDFLQARSRPRDDIDLLPGDDFPDFQFSPENWPAIAEALPPRIRDKPDNARRFLERLGRSYRGQFSYPSDPRRRSKNWTNVAKLSTRLAEAIRTARRYPNYLEGLVLLLEDLAIEAMKDVDRLELITARGARRPHRETLYRAVVDFWLNHGGKLRRSRTPERAARSGPAVRFLKATLGPLLGEPISDEAVIDIIVRERNRRDPGISLDERLSGK